MTEPRLIPVPRGMCGAFYQFMGAGAQRGDDGQIMMLNPRRDQPSDPRPSLAAELRRAEDGTVGQWVLRPNEFDDWGFIRDANGHTVAIAKHGGKFREYEQFQRLQPFDEVRHRGPDYIRLIAERIVSSANHGPTAWRLLQRIREQAWEALCSECGLAAELIEMIDAEFAE